MSSAKRDRTAILTAVLHAIVFVGLAWWSWRKWPDPLVDFGRELYVPWQITTGKVLYRDLASLFGPLSPYLNALWFTLFGVSLMTLALCNMAIFAAMLAGIYHLIRISTDRITATVCTLTTMVLFGFSQYVPVGNYNYITPYAHEATHGIALSVATLVALYHGLVARRASLCAAAGVCLGLVLLTKPEISVALVCGAATGVIAAASTWSRGRRALASCIATLLAAAAVPAMMFFAYFVTKMSPYESMRAVTAGWTTALTTAIASNHFYRRVMGVDLPFSNAVRMLQVFGGFVLVVIAAAGLARTRPAAAPGRTLTAAVWFVAAAVLAIATAFVPWNTFPRALPLIVACALAAFTVMFVRRRAEGARAEQLLPIMMWSAFALVLMAKMILNARFAHYGFYLAAPGASVTLAVLFWLIPRAIDDRDDRGSTSTTFRYAAACLVAAAVSNHLLLSNAWYGTKTVPVGRDRDSFLATEFEGQWYGPAARDALNRLDCLPRDATVAVLPEGVMLNYLSRRETPLRVVTVMPPEIIAFGEEQILASLERRPPDVVLLVRRDVMEYQYPPFGADARYGRSMVQWVRSRYETVEVICPACAGEADAGIEILRRRPSAGR